MKRAFSLIEILITCALLAIVTAALTFGGIKLLRYEKFSASVKRLLENIELAKEVAFDYDVDISCALLQTEKGVSCMLFVPPFVPEHIRKSLNTQINLNGIKKMLFNEQELNKISLTFYPHGIFTPEGKIEIFGEGSLAFSFSSRQKNENAPYPKKK